MGYVILGWVWLSLAEWNAGFTVAFPIKILPLKVKDCAKEVGWDRLVKAGSTGWLVAPEFSDTKRDRYSRIQVEI